MSNDKTYNGWSNYETWVIHLWLTNDERTQEYWRDAAAIERGKAKESEQVKSGIWTVSQAAKFNLADRLKDEMETAAQEILNNAKASASVWSDLLNSALSEADWNEIADAFLQ